jgi:diaminopimelate epimerase
VNRWSPRPRLSADFFKGHGLGNDYLVFQEDPDGWFATPDNVRRVCHRHRGVGSDGIVAVGDGGAAQGAGPWALRMFNPDGGEFERSGNGLRIFAAWASSRTGAARIIEARVGGEVVRLVCHGREGPVHDVAVEMGRASVGAAAVAMDAAALDEDGTVSGPATARLPVIPVSVGNPHLVVPCDRGGSLPFTEESLGVAGPHLTSHPSLAYGANVQLVEQGPGRSCRALIWERGVGRTSASGTSACAVAVALVSSGRMEPGQVTVEMPGGDLQVEVDSGLEVVLRGPVEEILDGSLRASLLATFEPGP